MVRPAHGSGPCPSMRARRLDTRSCAASGCVDGSTVERPPESDLAAHGSKQIREPLGPLLSTPQPQLRPRLRSERQRQQTPSPCSSRPLRGSSSGQLGVLLSRAGQRDTDRPAELARSAAPAAGRITCVGRIGLFRGKPRVRCVPPRERSGPAVVRPRGSVRPPRHCANRGQVTTDRGGLVAAVTHARRTDHH